MDSIQQAIRQVRNDLVAWRKRQPDEIRDRCRLVLRNLARIAKEPNDTHLRGVLWRHVTELGKAAEKARQLATGNLRAPIVPRRATRQPKGGPRLDSKSTPVIRLSLSGTAAERRELMAEVDRAMPQHQFDREDVRQTALLVMLEDPAVDTKSAVREAIKRHNRTRQPWGPLSFEIVSRGLV